MSSKTIGEIVEGAGVLAVIAGAVAGFHHLLFSIPVALGLVAIYVGKKIAAGTLTI